MRFTLTDASCQSSMAIFCNGSFISLPEMFVKALLKMPLICCKSILRCIRFGDTLHIDDVSEEFIT